jgi:Na+(H+)/acetate symporter ActP
MMQAIQKHESSTLFDFAALRNYEGLCFLMLDIGMEGSQLFAAFQHLLQTGKYTLAQVLIKKYSASEVRTHTHTHTHTHTMTHTTHVAGCCDTRRRDELSSGTSM